MAASESAIPVPQVSIQPEHKALFTSINTFVYAYMSNYDNSHDYHHILRVISNANRILQAETKSNPSLSYDTSALFLAALLHDVGDRKYIKEGEDTETQIYNILIKHGAAEQLATKVQAIVKHVSYTTETRNPDSVTATLAQYPELAIVQDADRLDAIGAVGVARCFSFGAAKFPDKPMNRGIEHFEEKLYKLAGMMKTASGREMAQRRKVVLEEFAKEFVDEAELSFALN
ncbi:hypothetical protein FB567DRAFT_466835 [Paraphoma chrysanthemicola]|uniref:HD/PDEase domain-containing protein n=1 Tax=Paraphoma chrysanthemicola TaxID=798071 RepID=A0A8K0RAE3_9PLEO|nr:hypothetical protein FB567DRAFT_466835 [Paraphoma chrysanthemicola]